MADKKYASITAITQLWAKIKALIPTKVSDLTNDSGYLTSESDPVFNASAAANISAADISSWNGKVSDDHKWNDVALDKISNYGGADVYVPYVSSTSGTTANLVGMRDTASSRTIAVRTSEGYLRATTPSASDDSTRVATTAFVKTAIPTNVSTFTNDAGYLTLATLPLYDGSYTQTAEGGSY